MSIAADIQRLEPGAQVRLYELDATGIGADTLHFHSHLQENSIWWQGVEYGPWPIEATGFRRKGDQPPQPRLLVSNISRVISTMCLLFDDLVGAKLHVRRTLVKYLDARNFPNGNPAADPNEHFPDEMWFIERKVNEDREMVEFELASAIDLNGQQFPGRQIIAGTCGWITRGGYRGPYCGYAGPPAADVNDQPTDDPARDVCSGRLKGCKLRFGEKSALPYGGYPAAGLVRT